MAGNENGDSRDAQPRRRLDYQYLVDLRFDRLNGFNRLSWQQRCGAIANQGGGGPIRTGEHPGELDSSGVDLYADGGGGIADPGRIATSNRSDADETGRQTRGSGGGCPVFGQ